MDIENIVNKILKIPSQYNTTVNKSIVALLQETGYFEMYENITIDIIFSALKKNPQYIKEWVGYSEDKRVSSGWYILTDEGKNIVGHFSTKDGYNETETEYSDLTLACAVFIKNEIEGIRIRNSSSSKK